jgi:hypothetical protein
MSVAVERRTVALWPVNASPVSSGPQRPRKLAVVPPPGRTDVPAAGPLAAITSSYRDGRAGIISGDSSPSAGQLAEESPADLARATHATVPLGFLAKPKPPEAPQDLAADQGGEATTLWSRLVRARRPAPRGRHALKS